MFINNITDRSYTNGVYKALLVLPLGVLNSLLCQVDPTFRSLLEETSVDYIHTFRDLASQMNTDH